NDVIADDWQILNFLLGKNFTNRRTRSRQDRVRLHGDFNRLRLSRYLKREIQAYLRSIAELNLDEALGLKARQLGFYCVSAGKQARQVVGAGFVADDTRYHAGCVVRSRNRHAG